jgi:hypothetical protein
VFTGPLERARARGWPAEGRRDGEPLAAPRLCHAYATPATSAGVDEDTVGNLLNHGGRSVTARYIKTSYLGRMLAAAQEDISTHLIKGSPRGRVTMFFARPVTSPTPQ